MNESLEERMARIMLRHTVGPDKPSYFLLHPDDVKYMIDRHLPDMSERYREEGMAGIHQLTFHGLQVVESDLASKGNPMVACAE